MMPELLLLLLAGLGATGWMPGLAGEILVYPLLGVIPGWVLAASLLPGAARSLRIAVALALAPLVTCVLGWLLVAMGTSFVRAAWVIAGAGWVVMLGHLVRTWRSERNADLDRLPAAAVAWALGLALVLLLVPVINPYIFIRGDSWIHGGIVTELRQHGFPPEDARMAGVRLSYVWFFNFFIALLASVHDGNLFHFMTLSNVACAFATVLLAAQIARRVWRSPEAATATAVLLTLGLNAGAFLLWPLNLARAAFGKVRGWSEALRLLHGIEFGSARIIYSLGAPFAEPLSFLDKLLVGTAVNLAYLHMTLYLWALIVWLEERRRSALVLLTFAAAGTMFFHSVVGLSVLPVSAGLLVLTWLARSRFAWLPERGASLAALVATLAGMALTAPYMRSITAGWAPEKAGFRHRFLQFEPSIPWTIATACAFVLVWSLPAVRRGWDDRRPLPVLLAAWAAAMIGFACAVDLPYGNTVKFVYEIFTPCAVLASPVALERFDALKTGRRLRGALVALCFLVPTLLTLHGYLVDPTGRTREELHPVAGEDRLYAWMRRDTSPEAVMVDAGFRDLIAVKGARRLYLGTTQAPDLAAFPAPEMARRRAVMQDLYGALPQPDSTVARLRALGRPLYVLYRPNDTLAVASPWRRLLAATGPGSDVYDRDGFHVVRVAGP